MSPGKPYKRRTANLGRYWVTATSENGRYAMLDLGFRRLFLATFLLKSWRKPWSLRLVALVFSGEPLVWKFPKTGPIVPANKAA